MKRFYWVICVMVIGIIIGQIIALNIKQYKQIEVLKQQIIQLEQSSADIRDQWVAWQRQDKKNLTPSKINQNEKNDLQIQQIRQSFEFVQFAMQQQQWVIALQRLEQIEQQIDDFPIAESLKLSLQKSVLHDKEQIKGVYQQSQQQQQVFRNMIQQLEQSIQDQTAFHYQPMQQRSFLQRLLIIERTSQPTVNVAHYQLLLKEIQLDVMMLNNINILQDPIQFQQRLSQILTKAKSLPVPIFNSIEIEIHQLMSIKMIIIPKLTSLDVLSSSDTP